MEVLLSFVISFINMIYAYHSSLIIFRQKKRNIKEIFFPFLLYSLFYFFIIFFMDSTYSMFFISIMYVPLIKVLLKRNLLDTISLSLILYLTVLIFEFVITNIISNSMIDAYLKIYDYNKYADTDNRLLSKINKAMTIIQFKLEGMLIKKHPEYNMNERLLLDKVNYKKGTITLGSETYKLNDQNFPTINIDDPFKLTKQEKEIVDMHAQLGYELLSETGMNNRVLELIKNHHNPMSENADVLGQILSVADIYSALREPRSYKDALKEGDAFKLLDQKARKGEVSTEVVNALKKALTSKEST